MKWYDIIFEDEHLIAVNKPAGMLVIADRYDSEKPFLKKILARSYGDIFTVHRLDIDTSGVLIFARDESTHRALSMQFEKGEIDKSYLALSLGPPDEAGLIDAPIREKKYPRGHYEVHSSGKPSQTGYRVVERYGRFALLDITLHTGRTHQIRVHLKHAGFPLLVDEDYGLASAFYLSEIKRIRLARGKVERPLLKRSSLHSHILSLTHPVTHTRMSFEGPPPKDMKAVIYQCRKEFN